RKLVRIGRVLGSEAWGRRAGRGTRFEPGCGDAVRQVGAAPAEGPEETTPESLSFGLTGRGLRTSGRSPRGRRHYKGGPARHATGVPWPFSPRYKTERSEFGIPPPPTRIYSGGGIGSCASSTYSRSRFSSPHRLRRNGRASPKFRVSSCSTC